MDTLLLNKKSRFKSIVKVFQKSSRNTKLIYVENPQRDLGT